MIPGANSVASNEYFHFPLLNSAWYIGGIKIFFQRMRKECCETVHLLYNQQIGVTGYPRPCAGNAYVVMQQGKFDRIMQISLGFISALLINFIYFISSRFFGM